MKRAAGRPPSGDLYIPGCRCFFIPYRLEPQDEARIALGDGASRPRVRLAGRKLSRLRCYLRYCRDVCLPVTHHLIRLIAILDLVV
jgi:hypothetical protein